MKKIFLLIVLVWLVIPFSQGVSPVIAEEPVADPAENAYVNGVLKFTLRNQTPGRHDYSFTIYRIIDGQYIDTGASEYTSLDAGMDQVFEYVLDPGLYELDLYADGDDVHEEYRFAVYGGGGLLARYSQGTYGCGFTFVYNGY